MSDYPFQIWVDADACPIPIKEILFRTARRLEIRLTLVANGGLRVPTSELINVIVVPHGADIADKKIVELMRAGDIVITGDIPLAAAVVSKGGIGIGTRGQLFDDSSVQGFLASRNIGEQLRAAGIDTKGPKPHTPKETQTFANQIDRILTKSISAFNRKKK